MKKDRVWFIFAGCCVVGLVFVGLVCNTAGLYFQDMAAGLGLPMAKVTLTMSFLNAGGLIGMFFAGRILDGGNVRVPLSIAAAAVGAGLILASSCSHIAGFYVLWAVIGFCSPLLVSVALPTLLGNWFREKLGLLLGIVYGLSGIGGALFNALTGRVIAGYGWRRAMLLEGIVTLAALLPFTLTVFRLRPDGEEGDDGTESAQKKQAKGDGITERDARRMTPFYLFITANIALTVVSSLLQQISPHVISLGYSVNAGSSVISAEMLGCAAGNVIMGWLLDHRRPAQVTWLYTLFGLVGWMGLAVSDSLPLLVAGGVLAGLGQALFQTGIPFCVRQRFGSLEYSKIYSDIALPSSAVAVFSASLGGILYDWTGSYVPVMALLGIMFALAGPCMVRALDGQRRAEPGVQAQR